MKYFLYLLFIVVITAACYGFYIKPDNEPLSNKFIGSAVLSFFFVWMPLFIYHRYKNKDLKKYMITDETVQKIKDEAETFLD